MSTTTTTDSPDATHRVHVVPWIRHPGRILLRNWLAITIGRHIWTWRPLDGAELRHEVAHVGQWRRHGVAFALIYLLASIRSWRSGTGWYTGNRFEVEARAAATPGRAPSG